jgi:hypothetical protein
MIVSSKHTLPFSPLSTEVRSTMTLKKKNKKKQKNKKKERERERERKHRTINLQPIFYSRALKHILRH